MSCRPQFLEISDKLADDPVVAGSFCKAIICQHRTAPLIFYNEHGYLLLKELVVH